MRSNRSLAHLTGCQSHRYGVLKGPKPYKAQRSWAISAFFVSEPISSEVSEIFAPVPSGVTRTSTRMAVLGEIVKLFVQDFLEPKPCLASPRLAAPSPGLASPCHAEPCRAPPSRAPSSPASASYPRLGGFCPRGIPPIRRSSPEAEASELLPVASPRHASPSQDPPRPVLPCHARPCHAVPSLAQP